MLKIKIIDLEKELERAQELVEKIEESLKNGIEPQFDEEVVHILCISPTSSKKESIWNLSHGRNSLTEQRRTLRNPSKPRKSSSKIFCLPSLCIMMVKTETLETPVYTHSKK